ncbi:NAD-dependent epimerase/dehydratase family protein [Microbulbifer sediminum]|uniref:NAD-dependent epimerase/dehydratase family protein n=1 Tax=Microbulbifer sediminum TaxID=2904250 RepID=UPI001F485F1C|nr:NAD-dependent epimerase/dehydratase family protein [Microbulbifer sediminum]
MSRWVIIGGTGYIGAALCHQLVESGLPVVSISRAQQGNPCCARSPQHTRESISLNPGADPGFVFQSGDRVFYATKPGRRPLRSRPTTRAALELDAGQFYSAARLRRALSRGAEQRCSQYLRGNL